MNQVIFRHKRLLFSGVFYSIVTAILSVCLSFSMGNFVTAAANGEFHMLWINACVALANILGQLGSYAMEGKYRQAFAKACVSDVKMAVTQRIMQHYGGALSQEAVFLFEKKIPQLATDYWIPIVWMLSYGMQMVIASTGLLWLDGRLFLLFTVISLIPIVLNPIFKKHSGIRKKQLLDQATKSHRVTSEWIQSLTLIQLAQAQPYFLSRMKESVMEIEGLREKSNNWDFLMHRLALAIGMLAQMICMIIAALFIVFGMIPVGGLTTATQLSNYIFPSINYINSYGLLIKTTQPLRDEVESYLSLLQPQKELQLSSFDIRFNHVQVHRGNDTIEYPDMVFREGQRYFLKGKSGSGKSTLLKLILQEESQYSGDLSVGNVEVGDLNLASFYQHIAYLPQEIMIYQGTLEENLTYFKTKENLDQLIPLIEDFQLTYLQGKMLTNDVLSGGEKQRIGIIRTLLTPHSIYLFDEPVSALDESLQQVVWKYIMTLKGMVIVVSHVYHQELLDQFDEVITLK